MLAAVLALPLAAQTNFGRISGTIYDASGAVIPGVKVVITDTDTQVARNVVTDAQGFYVAENLQVGPYSVSADVAGFHRAEQKGLELVADGHLTADFHLQVGESSQTVEVVATSGEALNTVSGEVSHVIDQEQVDNLALNGRNYSELLTLVPGAVITNPDQFSTMTTLSATNQSINGHRTNSNNLTVDGLGNLDNGSNGSLINNVSPDFLQEVKIQTSNFSAEYGRSAGVAFNIMTKNGTNRFHGGLFEYFRNNALDARNFFSPNKTELRYNDFGWDVGGPVLKNKLFFFVGEEWKRLRQQSAPSRYSLPTNAELQGNFVGTGHTINEPGTKTPYPENIIPASALTADGKAIANVYRTVMPLAATFVDQPITNNATFENPNPLNYREDLGRLDYHINEKHSLMGRWVDDYNSIYLATGPGGNLPITPEIRDRPGKSAMLSETWLISPTLINEARVGASWNSQHYWNQGDTWQRTVQGFTFQRVFNSVGPYVNGIPDVSITSFANWDGPYHTLISPTTEIEMGDTFTITHGQHTIRTGMMIIRNRKDQNGRAAYDGSITFNTSGNPNTTGYALADALLGNFNTYNEAAYDPMGHYRYTEPAAFVDDSWKVSRKLSVTLGLRYEYMMAMYSAVNNLANFVPSLWNPAQAVTINTSGNVVPNSGNMYNGLQRAADGVPKNLAYLVPNAYSSTVLSVPAGAPRGLYPNHNTWQPRIGFAYQVDEKTVIRSGFGLYYDRIQGNPTFYSLANPPFVSSATYNNGNLSNITGGSTTAAPWGSIQTISPNLTPPYAEQFSFGIQRNLPMKLFLETDYVGSLGRHLLVEPDINQPTWAKLASVPSTTNENSIRPYSGFGTIQQFIGEGTANYHALQVKITRRAGSVLFTGNYTWSKNLTDASSDTEQSYNYFNIHAMYGPAYSTSSAGSMDIHHAFSGTFVWYLPKLRDRNPYLRYPVGGWQLNGVLHLQTGPYLTVTGSTAIVGTRVADYVGGPTQLPNPGPNGWFYNSAFSPAPYYRWGTAGAGDIQGPGMQIYNLSVTKFFEIRPEGKMQLRFRADFYNAFNTVNFQQPSANISSSNFGTISSAYPPRAIQFGMKLQF